MRKSTKNTRFKPPILVSAEQDAEVFPAVRYFQINFEFLQEQIQLILRNQEALQRHMQQLENQLLRSGQGIRIDTRKMSPLERLTAGHSASQDSEAANLNLPGGR